MSDKSNTQEVIHFRGSELERLELCPGSTKAQASIKDTSSKVAESGSTIHAALAEVVTLETLKSAAAMEEAAEAYSKKNKLQNRDAFVLSWFSGIVQKAVEDRGGALELISEKRFEYDFSEDGPGLTVVNGTPDLIIHTVQGPDVFEYKTGSADVVTSEDHVQGQLYVLFASKKFDNGPGQIQATRLHILAAGNDKGEQHTFSDYDYDAQGVIFKRIQGIIIKASQKNAPRLVSLTACRYCKAAGTVCCQESTKDVDKFGANIIKMSDPVAVFMNLAPEARTATLDRAILVNRVLDKIIAAAKEAVAQDPAFLPGYAIGPSKTMREITSARAAFKILNEKAGISPAQFSEIVSVSLGDVKKLYTDHVQAQQKAQGAKPDTKKSLEESALKLLSEVIEIKTQSGSLKKIDNTPAN